MPFAAMSVQNRQNVLAWARRHSWGVDAAMSADGVLFGVTPLDAANDNPRRRRASLNFATFDALTAWARSEAI